MLSAEALKFDLAGALKRDGYAVIDDAVDAATCAALANEYESLHGAGLFEVSGNVVEEAVLVKEGVEELDLMVHRERRANDAVLQMCPHLAGLLQPDGGHLLLPYLQEQLPDVRLCALDQLKIQRAENPPHGAAQTSCFPMHFDTSADFETRRTVTVLLYLTDDDGVVGGELDVFPFPAGATAALAPKRGRVVVFGSFFLYHRTRPLRPAATADDKPRIRRALSLWFASDEKNDGIVAQSLLPRVVGIVPPLLVSLVDGDETRVRKLVATVNMHQNLRFLTKLWLAAEIEQSLKDAYGSSAANQDPEKFRALMIAVKKHRLTVEKLRGGIIPADVVAAIDAGLVPVQRVMPVPA